jgi:hypothetical protein
MSVWRYINRGPGSYWKFDWMRWAPGCIQLENLSFRDRSWPVERSIVGQFLVLREEKGSSLYHPTVECPALCREFGSIRTVNDALGFANKYGLIEGGDVNHEFGSAYYRRKIIEGASVCECAARWLSESGRMRTVLAFIDLLQPGYERELELNVRWVSSADRTQVLFRNESGDWSRMPISYDFVESRELKKGDVARAARMFVVQQINRGLLGNVSAMVLLNRDGSIQPFAAPDSLLAAMWLQAGELATGVRIKNICSICGGVLELTNKNRKHKRVHDSCSLRERVRRYREKKSGQKTRAK